MIYRVDSFTENNINPITNCEYDSTWLVFALSSDMDTPMIVGTNNGCAYTIKISKQLHDDWKMAVGDFIGYCDANRINGIIAATENEYSEAQNYYVGHSYNEAFLRDYETPVLVHSTSMENWIQIQKGELSIRIMKEEMSRPKLTREEILYWSYKFRKLNPKKLDHRRSLINNFVNSVFLYEDRMVITFNFKGSTETITFADLEKSALGSDLKVSGAPKTNGNPSGKIAVCFH